MSEVFGGTCWRCGGLHSSGICPMSSVTVPGPGYQPYVHAAPSLEERVTALEARLAALEAGATDTARRIAALVEGE